MEMENGARGGFLVAGSIIAIIGFSLPGLYGVTYEPPAHSSYAKIDLSRIPEFKGAMGNSGNSPLFNGFSGPVGFHLILIAIVATFVIGILCLVNGSSDSVPVAVLGRIAGIGAAVTSLVKFIWTFRYNHTPSVIVNRFTADLGGGPTAVAASRYLHAQVGGGTLILLFGVLLGCAGTFKWGCLALVVFVLPFVGLYIYSYAVAK